LCPSNRGNSSRCDHPLAHRFVAELAERAVGDQVAPEVEGVVNGGANNIACTEFCLYYSTVKVGKVLRLYAIFAVNRK